MSAKDTNLPQTWQPFMFGNLYVTVEQNSLYNKLTSGLAWLGGVLPLVVGEVDVEVEAVLRLLAEAALDAAQVAQPPAGHGAQRARGVGRVGQLLRAHRAVPRGRQHARPVHRWPRRGEPGNQMLLINLTLK